jgi:tetratricopeptide (TPR) repeat protein
MAADPKIEIKLLGPFRIRKGGGEDCTPRGRKSSALVAMLALSPENKRSRVWIQDKLWGSRGKEQGAASLRQSLAEIRRVLGGERTCIVADNYSVSLVPGSFATDLDGAASPRSEDMGELLEGFDIGEEGFEDWLREQRRHLSDGAGKANGEHRARKRSAEGDVRPPPRSRILLVRGDHGARGDASILADSLVDSVAKTIAELAAATILDRRTGDPASARTDDSNPAGTLTLHSEVVGSETKQTVRFTLLQVPANTLAWSSSLQLSGKNDMDLNNPAVMRCINLVVNVAIDQLMRIGGENPQRMASAAMCYSGILRMYRLGKINFEAADKLFADAFDIEPRGIYLAWRAYLRTFLLAERQYSCRQTIEAEAFDFMHRALELEPHNSYVAALSAHVHAMMRRSYVAAYELAERSVLLNHANPIGWACLGIAKSYLGKSEEGFRHTLLARTIAGSSPFRYQLDALSCIAGTMAGELDKAVRLGEASHALAPQFAPPLRYLSALYAHGKQHDLSAAMVQKLRATEPDFSYDSLRDTGYPAAGLHRTAIIRSLPKRQI